MAGTFCYFCGKPGFSGAMCSACMIALPDPSAPEPPNQARTCPRCLTAPLMPVQTGDPAGSVCYACQQCHGLFIGPRSWCAFIAQPELALAFEARLGPRATPPKELLALLSCPTCKRQMERGRFAASSSVVVDVCTAHGTWLDAGELSDVVKHGSTRAASATAPTDVAAYNEALRYHLSAAMRPVVVAQPPAKRNVPLAIILFLLFALLSALGGAKAMSSSKEKLDDAAKAAGSAGQELR